MAPGSTAVAARTYHSFTVHRRVLIRYLYSATQAVDTQGNWWRCSRTSDTSCNKYLGYGSAYVIACCTRE